MPQRPQPNSRRQQAAARRNHIRELVALGLSDFFIAERLGISQIQARKYRKQALQREIKEANDHELQRVEYLLQLDNEIAFCRLKAREAHARGTGSGHLGWQTQLSKLLAMKARAMGFNTPQKIEVEHKETVEVRDVLPEGLTIVEDYPWLLEEDLEERNRLYLEHQTKLEGTSEPDPDNITEAEFEDIKPEEAEAE